MLIPLSDVVADMLDMEADLNTVPGVTWIYINDVVTDMLDMEADLNIVPGVT